MAKGASREEMIDLRLIVITDAACAQPRRVVDVVAEALAAGAPAVQLRDKHATARELFAEAVELRALTRKAGALLFVNDRIDVALAADADGAHIGPDDMPIAAARKAVPAAFLLGTSTDDPAVAQQAAEAGASYIGCGAVFGTKSKDVGDERIGTEGLRLVVAAVDIPVIGIGGVDARNVVQVAQAGAAGAAVISAVMGARDVGETVQQLLRAFPR